MEFEFDEAKSLANCAKHGIDFVAAQHSGSTSSSIEIPAKTTDEPRSVVIGVIGTKHYSAVITHREGRVRMISVRRSRPEEVAFYEGE